MDKAPLVSDPISQLNRLFLRALRALGDAGQTELACHLAAEGWSQLRPRHADDAEKLNGVLHYLTRPRRETSTPAHAAELDVRHLAPAQRHVVILETCMQLAVGNAVELINDHDPKPLYYQFEAEYPGQFGWSCLESGPATWRVQITRQRN